MKAYEFHPLAEVYPLMPEDDLALLVGRMKLRGFNKAWPIILYKGKVLDGRNRYLAAKAAEVRGVTFEVFKGTEEEAREYVEDANEHRRHLQAEWLAKHRLERIERVAAARGEGMSERAIAEQEGVSQKTVHEDLKIAAASVDTPPVSTDQANGTVTGVDGKTYAATKPKKTPLLCDRCTRVGPTPGCNRCKETRAAAAAERKAAAEKHKAEATEMADAFGTPIPKGLLDVWADPWIQKTFDFLASMAEAYREQRIVDGMKKRKKHYPFFDAGDFMAGAGFIDNYLDQLIDHLKAFRPAGVCPQCQGKKCVACRSSGLVPREVYKKLTKAAG